MCEILTLHAQFMKIIHAKYFFRRIEKFKKINLLYNKRVLDLRKRFEVV